MKDDARLIPMVPINSQPSRDDRRGAQTLRREVQADGSLETRAAARARYRELGIETPEEDPYYES